jgi:hypothetical protein
VGCAGLPENRQAAGRDHRATVGTLFEFEEICRTDDLEALVRHANEMAGCRSFEDVVAAFQAMRRLAEDHSE